MGLIKADFVPYTQEELETAGKVADEKSTKRRFINYGKINGCEFEMRNIYLKYETLDKFCKNKQERKQLAEAMLMEIDSLIGRSNDLVLDGKVLRNDKAIK